MPESIEWMNKRMNKQTNECIYMYSRSSHKQTPLGDRNSVRNWSWMLTRMSKYSKSLYKSQVKRGFFKAAISKAVLLMKVSVKKALTAFTHAFICSFVRSLARSLIRLFVHSFSFNLLFYLFLFIYVHVMFISLVGHFESVSICFCFCFFFS